MSLLHGATVALLGLGGRQFGERKDVSVHIMLINLALLILRCLLVKAVHGGGHGGLNPRGSQSLWIAIYFAQPLLPAAAPLGSSIIHT